MTETFSIQVHPDAVNDCIQVYEAFGWSVLSTQEVVRNLPPKQIGSDTIENVVQTYNKVTFQREITKYTPTLKQYQQEYENCVNLINRNKDALNSCHAPNLHVKRLVAYVGLILLGLLTYGSTVPAGVVLLVIRIVRYNTEKSAYNKCADQLNGYREENKKLETRKQEILTESRAYLMTVSTAE